TSSTPARAATSRRPPARPPRCVRPAATRRASGRRPAGPARPAAAPARARSGVEVDERQAPLGDPVPWLHLHHPADRAVAVPRLQLPQALLQPAAQDGPRAGQRELLAGRRLEAAQLDQELAERAGELGLLQRRPEGGPDPPGLVQR